MTAGQGGLAEQLGTGVEVPLTGKTLWESCPGSGHSQGQHIAALLSTPASCPGTRPSGAALGGRGRGRGHFAEEMCVMGNGSDLGSVCTAGVCSGPARTRGCASACLAGCSPGLHVLGSVHVAACSGTCSEAVCTGRVPSGACSEAVCPCEAVPGLPPGSLEPVSHSCPGWELPGAWPCPEL